MSSHSLSHSHSQTRIDPRLQYGSIPPTAFHANATRLPRIHHAHELPALSNANPIHPLQRPAPYYRLPPAAPIHSSPVVPLPPSPEQPHTASDEVHNQYSGGELASPGSVTNPDPNDPKRSRACEACRGLKVRCDQDQNFPEQPCKRCAKAKRQCVITAPSRKRQKKSDTRVAELEKKIDALTASLHAQAKDAPVSAGGYGQDSAHLSPPESNYSISTVPTSNSPLDSKEWSGAPERKLSVPHTPIYAHSGSQKGFRGEKRRHPQNNEGLLKGDRARPTRPPHPPKVGSTDSDKDLPTVQSDISKRIDEIVDAQSAIRIFDRYVLEMAIHLPVVLFSPGTAAAEIRSTKPILFLSILVAASVGMTDLRIQQELAQIVMGVFADCIIRNGEKSLELVQALQIATIWYRPPKRYEQMNFYQLSHIAAVMAIDVGMGKRLNSSKNLRMVGGYDKFRRPKYLFNADTVEARRTWLGCYFLCANTSMSLRRPNLIRWTNYMDECIDMLESSTTALPSDKLLCQHVKLQHINEEIGLQFSMDDPSATITISDTRVQYALKAFEHQLQEWSAAMPKSIWNPGLQFCQYASGLYMHEVAMHINHNVDDFRAPFTEESIKAASGQSIILSPAHSAALCDCMTSVHGMFRTFFSFDPSMIRALPIFYFVRIAYAVVVLIKLYFAVTAPGSEVAKIFSKEDLEVESHLDNLLRLFHSIKEEDAFRPANKFLMILGQLCEWFQKNKDAKAEPREASKSNPWAATDDPERRSSPHPQMLQQQQLQRQQMQQLQQNVGRIGNGGHGHPQHGRFHNAPNTPLHFLSEVAIGESYPHTHAQDIPTPNAVASAQTMINSTNAQPSNWYNPPLSNPTTNPALDNDNSNIPSNLNLANGDFGATAQFDYGGPMMGAGFEQAMDMTLGTADGDLSSLFMGDPMFNFGLAGLNDGMVGGNGYYGMGDGAGRW